MSQYTELTLAHTFDFPPKALLIAGKRLPLDDDGFVPVLMRDQSFELVKPTLLDAGNGAVCLSLGLPFGFRTNGKQGVELRSQLTQEMVLEPSCDDPNRWVASLFTDGPLSRVDAILFSHGIGFYATHAETVLSRRPTNPDPQ